MSTRDEARLTPKERAALAGLEAAAVADDPQLAARLRGSSRVRILAWLPVPLGYLRTRWASLLVNGWWGLPILAAGLALVVLAMSGSLAIGVLGILVAAIGLRMVVQAVNDRVVAAAAAARSRPPGRPDEQA